MVDGRIEEYGEVGDKKQIWGYDVLNGKGRPVVRVYAAYSDDHYLIWSNRNKGALPGVVDGDKPQEAQDRMRALANGLLKLVNAAELSPSETVGA